MTEISTFFVKAFQAVMADKPLGSRAQLAEKANISRSQVTDILKGRRYGGSEEVRRSIAAALGWNYDDFLKYGECLENNKDFILPSTVRTIYKPELYISVPQFQRIIKKAVQSGYRWCPVFSDKYAPFIFLKSFLGKHFNNEYLAVCKMSGNSMAPTIMPNSFMLVDTSVQAAENDKVFIFNENTESDSYSVKRVKIKDDTGEIFLLCDNGNVPELFQGSFPERTVAKVLWSFYPYE